MDNTTWIMIVCFFYLPNIIITGIVARVKGDFFSRGAAIGMFVPVFGFIFMMMAPQSKARDGDKQDIEHWHIHGSKGGLVFFGVIIICLIYFKFIA
jgi:hypothetical protein